MSVWLSVDPLAEINPGISPYNYCILNPINRIDPNGLYDKKSKAQKAQERAVKRYGDHNVGDVYQKEGGGFAFRISSTGFKQHYGNDIPKGAHAFADGGIEISNTFDKAYFNAFRKGNISGGKYFEGIRVYKIDSGRFKDGAAVTIPGVGILTGPDPSRSLLKHEYGHILQRKLWGADFYLYIGITSLNSARRSETVPGFHHDDTWTEWSANVLSRRHFSNEDWDGRNFPLEPSSKRKGTNIPVVPLLILGSFNQ